MYTHRQLRALISTLQQCEALAASDNDPVASAFELGVDHWDRSYSTGYCDNWMFRLAKERQQLEQRLEFLAREQNAVAVARRRAINLLKPVNRLPQELLGMVLSLTMHYDDDDDRADRNMRFPWGKPPLSTCHNWRKCLLRLPSIWSTVCVDASTKVDELKTWLLRASQNPLRVTLELNTEDNAAHVRSMWNLLSSHVVRSFTLQHADDFDPEWIFPLEGHLDKLEKFKIYLTSTEQYTPNSTTPIFGPDRPHALKSFILMDLYDAAQYDLGDLDDLNLTSLTHVVIYGPYYGDWSFLSQCVGLESLELTVSEQEEPEDFPLTLLNLPKLARLTLEGKAPQSFLQRAHLPSLCQLSLDGSEGRKLLPYLLPLTNIQRLKISHIPEGFSDLLNSFTQLEHLWLDAVDREDITVLSILTRVPSTSTKSDSFICPKLRVLECYSRTPVDQFLPLVSARVNGISVPLRIYLPNHKQPKGNDWEDWMDHLHFKHHPSILEW